MKTLQKPFLSVLGIFLLCMVFRVIEYFFIRTDQTFWGEAFLHKLAGVTVLCVVVKVLSSSFQYLGFSKAGVIKRFTHGLLFGLLIFIIAYGVEILLAVSQGKFQTLQLYVSSYSVDGNVGNQTDILFFLICIAGNLINVLMEEGVFRGLFQKILQQKYTFLVSAVIAALFFGLWHVISPLRNYYDGLSSMGGTIANILMLVATTALGGFKFALMTKLTGSLYMAMGDHFVNNTIVNLLHVTSSTGSDELLLVRMTIAQTLSFVLVLIYYLKNRKRIR